MRRRPVIATVATATGFAGCLGGDFDGTEPTVEGEGVSVAPGEEGTITIGIEHAGSVVVSALPGAEGVSLPLGDVVFSTPPTDRDDSYPPYWTWSPPEDSLELDFPVRAADDADPGEYRLEVSAWGVEVEGGDGVERINSEAVREVFSIEVVEEE